MLELGLFLKCKVYLSSEQHGSLQLGEWALHIKSACRTILVFRNRSHQISIFSLFLSGHYPCFFTITILVLIARRMGPFQIFIVMNLNYSAHIACLYDCGPTFYLKSSWKGDLEYLTFVIKKKISLRLCKFYYLALQKIVIVM